MVENMTTEDFIKHLDDFANENVKLAINLAETKRFDPFQQKVSARLGREINMLKNTMGRMADEDIVPIEGWASLQWKDAYRLLARTHNTGYYYAIGRLEAEAEAVASALMADWLEEMARYGKGNLLGLRFPQRVE